jgi:hypothetical protein
MEPDPAPIQRFALEVQPEDLHRPWHAWLRNGGGEALEFDSPLELLRHLLSLNAQPPPRSGLR